MKIKFRKLKNGSVRVYPPHTIWHYARMLKKQNRDEYAAATKLKNLIKKDAKVQFDETDVFVTEATPKGDRRINFGVPERVREKLMKLFGFSKKETV